MCSISFLPFRFLRYEKDGTRGGNAKRQERSAMRMANSDQPRSTSLTLEQLPVELLQYIASFLTPDSAACFTLCSKSLQWAVGNQSWSTLGTKDHRKAKISFLESLQRDLREWLICHHCAKLHPFDLKPDLHTMWRFRREPPCTQADGVVRFFFMFELRFQYAQMIMKLHKLGATDNIYLDSVCQAHEYFYPHNIPHGHTSARVVNDNLVVKLEWRILLRLGEDFSQIRSYRPAICPHWRWVCDDDNLSERIRCRMSHGPNQSCAECAGIKQCQYCATEFIIAFLDSSWSPRGQAFYITAWKNLGPCDTPFDIRWRTQIQPIYNNLPAPKSSPTFVPGSIRRAFEDSAGSKIRVDGLSSIWPLDSDVQFSKLVADIEK